MPTLPRDLPKYIADIKDPRTVALVKEEKAKVAAAQEATIAEGKRRHAQREAQFESDNKEIFAKEFFGGIKNTQRQTYKMRQRVSFYGTNIPPGRMFIRRMIDGDANEDAKSYGSVVPVARREIRYKLIPFYQIIFHLFP